MNRRNLFSEASEGVLTKRLSHAFFSRLAVERERDAQRRLYLYSTVSFVSFVSSAAMIEFLSRTFVANGVYDFASLLVYDRGVTLQYAQDVMLATLQSLPILALSIAFVMLSILTYSSLKVIKLAARKNLFLPYKQLV